MSKHTSGPWTVGEPDRNEQPTVYSADGNTFVALCPHGCLASMLPEAAGNAALIAAAPDLLAALRDLLASSEARTRGAFGDLVDAAREAESAARAAIAKAEGVRP